MGKLFDLKEWLTVTDAAKHLSIVCGESVAEADVLRLALDGRLKLSVYFVNFAKARCGKVVDRENAQFEELRPEFVEAMPNLSPEARAGKLYMAVGDRLDENRYLENLGKVETIKDVWDLPMIGAERLDVEHEYQGRTGGPRVTLTILGGVLVEHTDGRMCQLQESFDDNPYQSGSKAELEAMNRYIGENEIEESVAESLLRTHSVKRKAFLAKTEFGKSPHYYPAGGLPRDSVFVVRTSALREFEISIAGKNVDAAKIISSKERHTLLTIIAALCDYSAINLSARGVAGQIAKMTEEIGAPVTDDTVRNVLAKIPEALQTRMK